MRGQYSANFFCNFNSVNLFVTLNHYHPYQMRCNAIVDGMGAVGAGVGAVGAGSVGTGAIGAATGTGTSAIVGNHALTL